MKLYELSPAEGSKERSQEKKAEATQQATARLPARVIRVRTQEAAAVFVPALKAVRCLYTDVCPNADLPIYLLRSMCQLTFKSLTDLTQTQRILPSCLKETGVISKICDGVVILGRGEIDKALTVKAARFSKSAEEKITKAGGKAQVM